MKIAVTLEVDAPHLTNTGDTLAHAGQAVANLLRDVPVGPLQGATVRILWIRDETAPAGRF